MKKLLQGAVLPFVIFISGMLLLGCNQAAEQSRQQDDAQAIETAQMSENTSDSNNNNQSTAKSTEDLKQGNMFYIARDVANVQLKTGDYVEKFQQSQSNLQQAIQSQNQAELQQSVKTLTRELQGFNTALISLDLKSQEIDGIRQQVLQANKQVLNSALLNGDLDISKVDFKKIEQQMNTIQLDMLKLAGMMIPGSNTEQATEQS
jgi:vacuolar-type H+-ATPase subunit I/STV1